MFALQLGILAPRPPLTDFSQLEIESLRFWSRLDYSATSRCGPSPVGQPITKRPKRKRKRTINFCCWILPVQIGVVFVFSSTKQSSRNRNSRSTPTRISYWWRLIFPAAKHKALRQENRTKNWQRDTRS